MPDGHKFGHMIDEGFQSTKWTDVLRARPDSPEGAAALSELCNRYRDPVLRTFKSKVMNERDAENLAKDLTQAFFAELLRGAIFCGQDFKNPSALVERLVTQSSLRPATFGKNCPFSHRRAAGTG